MLLNDLLIGFVLAAAFPLGYLLYSWSREEVDFVLEKYKILRNLEKTIPPFAVTIGILTAIFINKIEVVLVLFLPIITISSFTKHKTLAIKATGLFLLAFFVTYFLSQI